ncbi:TIGR00341 family protein [Xenococcus sp. PCC 7305]|uniref:TIGR00341 family protein n=1 Tax=Xenococcus sp. PCC 7305 TaxID=102125 RepID=UPI0002ACEAE2|nr:TIGR00341 family protein [Xenococcus sp. PCC 7305]ELS04154.1 TIGR00341 family protein [Xenococcus sp. PCC 7305]
MILTHNPRYVVYLRYTLRKINRRLNLKQLWYQDNGNWHWIKEKATPIASLNRSLWRLSVPSFGFHFMLGLSAIIATLGLLANNVAIIIGAMIIAPLMGPIVGMAYSIAMGNRMLLRRSSLTIIKGIVLTILASWLTASVIGLKTVDSEILSRTNPTLIDFGIAMAAGAAGAFANTRRSISDAIPGVAIAVALVPPLSVIGIGLALGEEEIVVGSSLLFLTNLICIIFFGGLVFLFQSYGNIERAKQGLVMSTVVMFLLAIPLTFSMRKLIVRKNFHYQISNLIVHETNTFANSAIRSIKVISHRDYLNVKIEVAAPIDTISQEEIDQTRQLLSRRIGQDIDLEVKIIPVKIFKSPNS